MYCLGTADDDSGELSLHNKQSVPRMMKTPKHLAIATEDMTPPVSVWVPQMIQLTASHFSLALEMSESGSLYSIVTLECHGCQNTLVDWSLQCKECTSNADRYDRI